MARLDPHSYADDAQPAAEHLEWQARVDFESHTLVARATLTFTAPAAGVVDFDTRDLEIHGVTGGDDAPLVWSLAPAEVILGARLRVELPAGTRRIHIAYRTSACASALQWLEPAQTSGDFPFLFSQCQAIHARSVVPLQDTPRLRIRYRAELDVPRPLRALMAARFVSSTDEGARARFLYEMPEPIPPYLFALAVGELARHDFGPRTRVWAEPAVLARAAYEFAPTPDMLAAAEKLFGPYPWERFDLLVMPPSFPYGGMENPRLTFLTPTLLAGDRSLVNVVAHELAHSWTGNLVTNANAEHFWLNEGFTVFAERRIVAALFGDDTAALDAALGRRELDDAIIGFASRPELTRLCPNLLGIDPDEAFSIVPYEKGYLFLRALEDDVGREGFDELLRRYIDTFRFRSLTTADFCAFVERVLPGALARVDAQAWLYEPGVPAGAPIARAHKLDAIESLRGALPAAEQAAGWSPTEWTLFLANIKSPAAAAFCASLESRFALSRRENAEIRCAFLTLALASGYDAVLPETEALLGQVGRMKYLKPLYATLARREATRPLARRIFERWKAGYHPIARGAIGALLSAQGA